MRNIARDLCRKFEAVPVVDGAACPDFTRGIERRKPCGLLFVNPRPALKDMMIF